MTYSGSLARRALLCAATSLIALSAGSALAQSSSTASTQDKSEGTTLQDIVVTGARRAQTVLEQERAAVGVVDSVAVGDISLNPQTNIADLAKRLPGVSVSQDQGRNQSATGEAQYVAIRGFDTSFNAYTLDGLRLPQTAGGRSISLNLFSPFAIQAIGIDKTPNAALDADAIAGIVNLVTPSAFDFGDQMLRLRAVGQMAELAEDRGQDGLGGAIGLDMSRRFADGRLGVYAAAYYEQKSSAAESVAVQNDYKTSKGNVGSARDNENALSADGLQWNFFNSTVERYGATAALDYRTQPLDLFARVNYATYTNTNTMNQTGLRSERTSGQTNPNAVSNPGGANYNAAGDYTPYGINPANYFRVEDVEQELLSVQTGGKLRFGGFTASLEAAYADGRLDSPNSIEAAWRGVAYNGAPGNTGVSSEGLKIDLSDARWPMPVLSSGATAYVASQDRPSQIYVQRGYSYLSEVKKTVKGDLTWTGSGLLASASIGGLYETADQDGRSLTPDDTRYKFRTSLQAGAVDGPSIGATPGQLITDFMGHGTVRPVKLVDRRFVEHELDLYGSTVTVSQEKLNQGLSDSQEDRSAAFAVATLKLAGGALEITPGVRYEDNHFEARFFVKDADGARFATADRDYDHVDPSVVAAWRPNDALVVRAAARSSYSRPSGGQLAGPTTVSRDPVTNAIISISQPNPDLKPVEGWSYDLGLEWYAAGANLQLAVYHKDLDNIVVPTALRNGTNPTSDGVIMIKPFNGLGGSATGVELGGHYALPVDGWLEGVSFGGNLTYQQTRAEYRLSSTVTRESDLPQAPELMYNLEAGYEHGPVRASLWYNHTGRRLDTVQDSQPDIYIQPSKELNLGVALTLAPGLEVGAAVRNLTDEPTRWSTVGAGERYVSPDRKGGYLETGRVFQVSVNATF
ncbi:TonB-dependent receptor [Brevundimonas sp. TSRC1-1]|uniref:TonB-dependent receptor n=1 Tax=Brevundimonas sp. TSRC1-1 TaxID=2804562 RepID=UPI003CEEED5A